MYMYSTCTCTCTCTQSCQFDKLKPANHQKIISTSISHLSTITAPTYDNNYYYYYIIIIIIIIIIDLLKHTDTDHIDHNQLGESVEKLKNET